MLETVQIITLLQGLFLIIILWINKKKYAGPTFALLILTIVSVIFFVVGNNQNGFFNEPRNWFFFDSSIFITFLLLFSKYYTSDSTKFRKRDFLYFLPNLAYFIVEGYENEFVIEGSFYIELSELIIEIIFLLYLVSIIFLSLKSIRQKWISIFIFPLFLIMGFSLVNQTLSWLGIDSIDFFNNPANVAYALIIIALLLYFITFKMIMDPAEMVHLLPAKKYKTSGLNDGMIEEYKQRMTVFMEVEKGYMESTLSLSSLSEKLNIPKQYISEILNMHLNTNFQDFVNGYRIEEFIDKLNKPEYANLTLVGIANEVGFNSKSNFYTAFKKAKGVTPTEYRKSLIIAKNKS